MVAVYRKSDPYKIVRLLFAEEFVLIVPDANLVIASFLIQFFVQSLDFHIKA